MLRPPNSPAPWPGASSHPCARCGEPTAGILPGDLCAACTGLLERRRNGGVLKEATDPATISSPATAVALVAARAGGATTQQEARAGARGQTRAFAREKDTTRATVVSVEPPQYRLGDGRFLLATPGTPLFPAELVRSEPQVTLALEASRSRPRTEIAYSAAGASWEAVYQVVLAGAGCQVSGAATIRSQSVHLDKIGRAHV